MIRCPQVSRRYFLHLPLALKLRNLPIQGLAHGYELVLEAPKCQSTLGAKAKQGTSYSSLGSSRRNGCFSPDFKSTMPITLVALCADQPERPCSGKSVAILYIG